MGGGRVTCHWGFRLAYYIFQHPMIAEYGALLDYNWQGYLKSSVRNQPLYFIAHHNFHVDYSGTEPGAPQGESSQSFCMATDTFNYMDRL